MLPSSVRRVVATTAPGLTSTTTRAATGTAYFTLSSRPNGHQRRFSSSKPSSPDNGSKELAQSLPAAKATESKSAGSEKRKRRGKDVSAQAKQLPSVPSTQHLSPEALGLSTFFSLHRPISVTHTFPKTVTDDAFAAIFTPRTQSQRLADVTSTLSSAVNDLEGTMGKMTLNNSSQENDDNAIRMTYHRADGSEAAAFVQLRVDSMTGQFLPFTPPPLPAEQKDGASISAEAMEASAEDLNGDMPSHRVYKAVLTIEETTDENGQVKVVAHSPQLIEEGNEEITDGRPPRTFLERMALRQLRYDDARDRRMDEMHAISVKRQKKLKMKKKKYKKLMRRTRNERRKLDRL